jgi:hypothetical protein
MIERDLAVRMFSSRNNFTGTLVKHLKDEKIFSFTKIDGTEIIEYNNRIYQFSTGEGLYAEVRQGLNDDIGLIFFSTSHSTLYIYENSELETDKKYNKINTHGVKLYTKKALLSTKNIMLDSVPFDKNKYISECIAYTTNIINDMKQKR